jgi:hypothetical protein
MITVRLDSTGAYKYLKDLREREIPKVVGRSLDRTAKATMVVISRNFRAQYNVSKKVIDKAIRFERTGSVTSISAQSLKKAGFKIIVSGSPIPLRDFSARPSKKGVTFQVGKGRARRVYMREGNKGFIIDRIGGHVFVRVGPDPPGAEKAPIKKVYGPSLPQAFSTRKQREAAIKRAQEVWISELRANARFQLSKRRP